MAILDLPSGTLAYETYGPADSSHPPVVFAHGVVADGRLWQPVAELLAQAGVRSYVPTLPLGAHRIPWGPDADRSPAGAARLLREFVDAVGARGATLVGCDTGGAICQFALDQDPAFVDRVMFTNCDAFEKFPPQPFGAIFALMRHTWLLRPLIAGPLQVTALRHSPLALGLLVTDPDPELTRSMLEPLRTDARIRDDLTAFLGAIDSADLASVTPRLHQVTAPVSVVWGTADRAFRPALGRRLAAVFEQATFTEVPGARTFVALDNPCAVVTAIVDISERPTHPAPPAR